MELGLSSRIRKSLKMRAIVWPALTQAQKNLSGYQHMPIICVIVYASNTQHARDFAWLLAGEHSNCPTQGQIPLVCCDAPSEKEGLYPASLNPMNMSKGREIRGSACPASKKKPWQNQARSPKAHVSSVSPPRVSSNRGTTGSGRGLSLFPVNNTLTIGTEFQGVLPL